MPFLDREWEDFQRDCDFFPAYTDYILGVDTRPEVADEPGLHPQILNLPSLRPQRIYGLPQSVQYPVAYDLVRDTTQTRPYTMPTPQPTSLLRQESSMESILPTPYPAPRVLSLKVPTMALLRSNELITDPQYSAIPLQERVTANTHITQAWSIVNSDAIPAQKAKAMGYLKNTSRVAAAKRQEYQARESARLEAEMQGEQEAELYSETDQAETDRQAQCRTEGPSYPDRYPYNEAFQAEADIERPAECVLADHEYVIRDLSQLPTYVQSRLPQLWTCTETIALQGLPAEPGQLDMHRQAQQYLRAFMQSVPPKGREWLRLVMDGMLKLRKQDSDPLTVLQTMPSVESTL